MLPMSNSTKPVTQQTDLVLPFYGYAALSFLAGTLLLLCYSDDFTGHYFNPSLLAITHIMALGWCTMIILGASHQLVPVIIEAALFSRFLARSSFWLAAIGIPLLVYGFYRFDMGLPAKLGGSLIVLAVLAYVINIACSIHRSQTENVQSVFIITAALWLLSTVAVGLVLVINFSIPLLPANSLDYLSLHAHMGLVGWFLLLIIGVGSKLIPMFLISKFQQNRLLWWIYALINTGLISFVLLFVYNAHAYLHYFPVILVLAGILLFMGYCYLAWRTRIRQSVDDPMKISLLSVLLMAVPALLLLIVMTLLIGLDTVPTRLITLYGFILFFGWLSSLILGMTFKTLPFIVWNKVYHSLLGRIKPPNPKDLYKDKLFQVMGYCFVGGLLLFGTGIGFAVPLLLKSGALLLLLTAILYNWNLLFILNHKAKT